MTETLVPRDELAVDNVLGPPNRVVITADSAQSSLRLSELLEYADLFRFFIWREVKVRYAQSALGISWAVFQPLVTALIMMVAFGYFAKIPTENAPRFLFYFCALVPWTFFSSAVTDGTASLVNNAQMLGKVYFPRIILPLASMVARSIDFLIAFFVLIVLMLFDGLIPTPKALLIPVLCLVMLTAAVGVGLWLTALAIQYRDVKYATTFMVQLMMFASPVIYPVSGIPDRYVLGDLTVNPQHIYALNPMAGVIEGFRCSLLGTSNIPWTMIGIGSVSAMFVAVTGVMFFRHKERIFADVA